MSEPRFAKTLDDLLTPADLAKISGFDFIEGMRVGTFPAPPIAETLNYRLTEVEKGRVVFEGAPEFGAYNPLGGAHGGWFGTLLDSCMACAVQTTLPKGKGYTTIEYKITILRPAFVTTPPLKAIGTVVSSGRRVATATGEMVDPDGKVYATGTTTCLVFEL
jgi:uncharacterized protein (TIGR00369 family)